MLPLFAYIYGKIASLRNTLYDRGVFEAFDTGVRVISVGNITAGGTGKTPLVAYIAGILAERGETVCILTRGYGRKDAAKRVLVTDGKTILTDAEHAGDEPFELANKLLGKAIIIADADRVSAAEWALRKFDVTTFLLDDGFQHRKVKRDLNIVCIDATDAFAEAEMLPAGRLRESLDGLRRADAVIITRSNLIGDISNLKLEISNLVSGVPVFMAENRLSGMIKLEEFHAKPQRSQSEESEESEEREDRKALAFCAIGNPESFFEQLRRENVDVVGTRAFRDHHIYSQNDLMEVEQKARESGAAILLTTAKDAVKLSNLNFEIPVFVVEIEVKIQDSDEFSRLIQTSPQESEFL